MKYQFNDYVFPGFYESGLSEAVDAEVFDVVLNAAVEHGPTDVADKVRRVLEAEGGVPPQARSTDDFGLPRAFWDAVGEVVSDETPWHKVFHRVAGRWAQRAAQALRLPGEFVELVSPREYNFGSDIIVMECSDAAWRDWVRQTFDTQEKRTVLERLVSERLRERPGFMPRYSNRLSEWPDDPAQWATPQTGIAVEAGVAVEAEADPNDDRFLDHVMAAVFELTDGIEEELRVYGDIAEEVSRAMPSSEELWAAIEKHMAAVA